MTEENCSNNRLGFKVEFRVTRSFHTMCNRPDRSVDLGSVVDQEKDD